MTPDPRPQPSAARGLAVLLLHSTDRPERAVAGVRAALATARASVGPIPPALVLDVEGARMAAKGVAQALSTGGRPNLVDQLTEFVRLGGVIFAVEEAWRERGFLDDALMAGAKLVPAGHLAALASAGYAIASY